MKESTSWSEEVPVPRSPSADTSVTVVVVCGVEYLLISSVTELFTGWVVLLDMEEVYSTMSMYYVEQNIGIGNKLIMNSTSQAASVRVQHPLAEDKGVDQVVCSSSVAPVHWKSVEC